MTPIDTRKELPAYDERVMLWIIRDSLDLGQWEFGRRSYTDARGHIYYVESPPGKDNQVVNVSFFARPQNPGGENI
jgi:hypothetical protein